MVEERKTYRGLTIPQWAVVFGAIAAMGSMVANMIVAVHEVTEDEGVPPGIVEPSVVDETGIPQANDEVIESSGDPIRTTVANPTEQELECALSFTSESGVATQTTFTVSPMSTVVVESELPGRGSFVRALVCKFKETIAADAPPVIMHSDHVLIGVDS